ALRSCPGRWHLGRQSTQTTLAVSKRSGAGVRNSLRQAINERVGPRRLVFAMLQISRFYKMGRANKPILKRNGFFQLREFPSSISGSPSAEEQQHGKLLQPENL